MLLQVAAHILVAARTRTCKFASKLLKIAIPFNKTILFEENSFILIDIATSLESAEMEPIVTNHIKRR